MVFKPTHRRIILSAFTSAMARALTVRKRSGYECIKYSNQPVYHSTLTPGGISKAMCLMHGNVSMPFHYARYFGSYRPTRRITRTDWLVGNIHCVWHMQRYTAGQITGSIVSYMGIPIQTRSSLRAEENKVIKVNCLLSKNFIQFCIPRTQGMHNLKYIYILRRMKNKVTSSLHFCMDMKIVNLLFCGRRYILCMFIRLELNMFCKHTWYVWLHK